MSDMTSHAPNPRLAARILLFDADDRLLLMQARHPQGYYFWGAPGGGLDPGESFESAAERELYEETGQSLPIGPCVWTRRHAHVWDGRSFDQAERFFIARTTSEQVKPISADGYIVGHRWWMLAEIEASNETFAPRRLAHFLRQILAGELPGEPVDCGV